MNSRLNKKLNVQTAAAGFACRLRSFPVAAFRKLKAFAHIRLSIFFNANSIVLSVVEGYVCKEHVAGRRYRLQCDDYNVISKRGQS